MQSCFYDRRKLDGKYNKMDPAMVGYLATPSLIPVTSVPEAMIFKLCKVLGPPWGDYFTIAFHGIKQSMKMPPKASVPPHEIPTHALP